MKISTKGRYALRLMLDLAINYENGYIPLKDIANRQQISSKYLEQIIIQLNKGGFLKSTRGAQGGYILARSPETYTVGEILRLMENGLAPVACLEECEHPCERMDECVTIEVYKKIKDAIDDVVDNMYLSDLVLKSKEKSSHVCKLQ